MPREPLTQADQPTLRFSDGEVALPVDVSRNFVEGEILASRYQIVRFIAAGGMGEVYEACDRGEPRLAGERRDRTAAPRRCGEARARCGRLDERREGVGRRGERAVGARARAAERRGAARARYRVAAVGVAFQFDREDQLTIARARLLRSRELAEEAVRLASGELVEPRSRAERLAKELR